MITLNYDITTGLAKFAATTVIKRFGDVPCQLVFSAAPGDVSSIKLSLGSDAASPAILAYTDAWTQESSTVWTAQLDATDTRLASYMSGMQSAPVDLELIVTIDGEAQYSPNLSLTVQQPIVTGTTSSDGGPTYYTEAETDSAIAAAVTAATTAIEARSVVKVLAADAADIVSNTVLAMNPALQWNAGAGQTWVFAGTILLADDGDEANWTISVHSTQTVAQGMVFFRDNADGSYIGTTNGTHNANAIGDALAVPPNGDGAARIVLIAGSVTMGGAAGVVGFEVAQTASAASAIRIKAGSFIQAQRA